MYLINEPDSKHAFSLRQHGTFLPLKVIFALQAKITFKGFEIRGFVRLPRRASV